MRKLFTIRRVHENKQIAEKMTFNTRIWNSKLYSGKLGVISFKRDEDIQNHRYGHVHIV